MVNRKAVFAGQFYEADPEKLKDRIEWCFKHPLGPGSIPTPSSVRSKTSVGFISPHAGYVYSGPIAAHTYYYLAKEGRPDTFIILGPNHTGMGAAVAIWPDGVWETPLGRIEIDKELASEISENSNFAKLDTVAHSEEHSIEVQLPFLQYIFNGFKIVPISMLYQSPETAKDLADAILKAVEDLQRDIIIIASTDMSHYEPHELAVKKDREALEKIVALDPEGLYSTVIERNITMCGVGPVMTLLYVARRLGSSKGEILKYATSGDVTGEMSWVVGYASVRILY
jgi:AmmeMemoRadiSam system protein B